MKPSRSFSTGVAAAGCGIVARIAAVQSSGVAKAASALRVTKRRRLICWMDIVMDTPFSPDGCSAKRDATRWRYFRQRFERVDRGGKHISGNAPTLSSGGFHDAESSLCRALD